MKNKKGFTLIELLAVIVILAVIALIVTPIVTGIITSAKESANARSVEGHIKNVEYAMTSSAFASSGELTKFDGEDISETTLAGLNITYPSGDNIKCNSYTIKNGTVTVAENCQDPKWSKQYCYDEGSNAKICTTRYRINATLNNLTISGVTKVNENESYTGTLSAVDNYSLPTTITVTMGDNTLTVGTDYTYDSSTGAITISKVTGQINISASAYTTMAKANGTAIYFNPETGNKCTSSEAVSDNETKTGCMKWYVLNDVDGNTNVDLLLDHNTVDGYPWNGSNSNKTGPSTAFLNQLWNGTDTWAGVPTRTDSYSLSNGTSTYTISYSGHKVKLLTATDAAKVTGNTTYNDSTATSVTLTGYGWLYDRTTTSCVDSGCANNANASSSHGYWTATAVKGSSSAAWYIYSGGTVQDSGMSNTASVGIRPVITIPKTLIY